MPLNRTKIWISVKKRIQTLNTGDKIFLFTVCLTLILGILMEPSELGTFLFTAVAAFFTYKSYIASNEEFRFGLFNERLKIYEALIVFCSEVLTHGGIREGSEDNERLLRIFSSAQDSFRGTGYHRSRALFGNDVVKLL